MGGGSIRKVLFSRLSYTPKYAHETLWEGTLSHRRAYIHACVHVHVYKYVYIYIYIYIYYFMQREACQILHTGCNKAAKTNQSKSIKRGAFSHSPFCLRCIVLICSD